MSKSRNLSILIDKEDYEKLSDISENEMRTISAQVRFILKDYLKEKENKSND